MTWEGLHGTLSIPANAAVTKYAKTILTPRTARKPLSVRRFAERIVLPRLHLLSILQIRRERMDQA
jgi:hypothetical protein